MPKKKSTKKRPVPPPTLPKTRVARSGIHGRGLFAEEAIAKDSLIGTYEGRETQRDGKYVLWIYRNDDTCYGIAGKNHMRFINHSRRPNAVFYGQECYALKAIRPGDEITFDYGDEWADAE